MGLIKKLTLVADPPMLTWNSRAFVRRERSGVVRGEDKGHIPWGFGEVLCKTPPWLGLTNTKVRRHLPVPCGFSAPYNVSHGAKSS